MAKLNTIGKIIKVILLLSCTHKSDRALTLQANSDTIPGTQGYVWKHTGESITGEVISGQCVK